MACAGSHLIAEAIRSVERFRLRMMDLGYRTLGHVFVHQRRQNQARLGSARSMIGGWFFGMRTELVAPVPFTHSTEAHAS